MLRSIKITITILVLTFWWIFSAVWNPGTMHVLARLSYRLSGMAIEESVGYPARERAWSYATRGGNQSEDIFFTSDEVAHLTDVSHLYRPLSFTLNFLSVLSWGILILAVYKHGDFLSAFRSAAHVLLVLLVSLSACFVLFPVFFELFHRVLFPGGNWAFPPDSLLIQLFPEAFWRLELLFIGILICIFLGVFSLLGQKRDTT